MGLAWRPRMPCFDPLGGGGEELACHALPPCHMAAHGCINRPSQRAAVAQASGGSIFGLATAVRAVSAALSSHDGDTLAAAPAALQLNGEGADDMRHSNMHMIERVRCALDAVRQAEQRRCACSLLVAAGQHQVLAKAACFACCWSILCPQRRSKAETLFPRGLGLLV